MFCDNEFEVIKLIVSGSFLVVRFLPNSNFIFVYINSIDIKKYCYNNVVMYRGMNHFEIFRIVTNSFEISEISQKSRNYHQKLFEYSRKFEWTCKCKSNFGFSS